MMNHFCTLFNSLYLSRGLAMYRSLEKYSTSFHLYIFAFDDRCFETLFNLRLKHATIIPLRDFEDKELLLVKSSRTAGEYCWTCTPSTIRYAIQRFGLDACTYLDADLLFFADPAPLLEEMGDRSVLITAHRYTREYDQTAISGKYCVQFVCFKNTDDGMQTLEWWRMACLEWCFNRVEEGRFGDQKYLDDWGIRFKGVHELMGLGGGVAPWNVQQYDFEYRGAHVYGREVSTSLDFPVVFYHYHSFKYAESNAFVPASGYRLSSNDLHFLYKPYVKALKSADKELRKIVVDYLFHEAVEIPRIRKSIRRMYKLYVQGQYDNYYHTSYFFR